MLILRWLTNKVFLIQQVKFYLQNHGRLPRTPHLRSQMLLCYFTMVVQVILSARLGAAVWSGISDCDETFNYWEPAHFMLYGNGLQTWEYQVPLSLDEDLSSSPINFQPTYALRSYLYILAHAVPGWIYSRLLQPNPMLVFYFLRCMFGFISALCEVLQFPPSPCSERYLTLFRCTSTAESCVSSEPTWADSVWQSWSSRRECSSPAPPSSPPPPPCTSACSPWEPGSTINITWPSSLQRFPRS